MTPPPGWDVATLAELIETDGIFSDGDWVETKDQDPDGEIRLTQLADVGEGFWRNRSERYMTAEAAQRLGCTLLAAGDVLVARMPDPLGRACVFPGDSRTCVTAVDVCIIRPGRAVDSRWLMWWLNTPQIRGEVLSRQAGTTRKRISRKNLAAIPLPIPPLAEQRRIVAALEQQLSRLDAADAQILGLESRLGSLRRVVIDGAVRGPWPERQLGEVAVTLRNGTFVSRPAANPPGVPIFRISAVRPMALDVDDVRFAAVERSAVNGYFVAAGDLLFTRYSGNPAYVGACAAVPTLPRPTLHPDKLIRVTLDREVCLPEFVELAFASTTVRRDVETRLKTTAGQVGIAGSQLRTVPLPIPPLDEQARISHEVRSSLAAISSLVRSSAQARRRSGALRRSILATAFRGELVPQDPNDESASVLLERIAAERAAASKPARNGREKAPA